MRYTEEMTCFMSERFTVSPVSEWVGEFTERFNRDTNAKNLYATCRRHGIKSGRNGQYLKGQQPWNAGKSHPSSGRSATTQFKKGAEPLNTRNVGDTRICSKDGYLLVKVAHKKWRPKQHLVWESEHGPIPKNYIVRFFDRTPDKLLNPSLDNLFCVSRGVNARLNKIKANEWPSSLRETLILIAQLEQKQHDIRREDSRR